MKHLLLILCLTLTACSQCTNYQPPQHKSTQSNGDLHFGTRSPAEPLANTGRSLNPASAMYDSVRN